METLASTVGANVKNFMGPLFALRSGVNRAGAAVARLCSRALEPEATAPAAPEAPAPGTCVVPLRCRPHGGHCPG